jgi:hypothetical protein
MPLKKKAAKKAKPRPRIRLPKGAHTETDFLILLDESGSMMSCREETISNFNEQVQVIKKTARGQDVKVSLATFSTPGEGNTVLWRKPVADVKKLGAAYQPEGSTAMYDCIVENLDRLSKELGEPRKKPPRSTSKPNPCVMVVIVSDGQENSSRASRSEVSEKIQALQKTNRWTFVYMGANQDLSKLQDTLHISKGNTIDYLASRQGTRGAGKVMAVATQAYLAGRGMGMTCSDSLVSKTGRITKVRGDTADSMAALDPAKWRKKRGN